MSHNNERHQGPGSWGHISPEQDAERILGQIERGEVQAGPEGARRIAAQHQRAYGAEVWGE